MRAPVAARGAIGALAAALCGCSVLVASPPLPLHCDPTVPEVCPSLQSCICVGDGDCTCVPCDPSPEQCNGMDDDCDGTADDGLAADLDGDTVAACEDGMPRDCDDSNPLVFPGNPEVCNGYDDDCDLRTVETGSCPDGFCGPPLGGGAIRCVDPSNCEDVGCEVGEVCRGGRCEMDATDDCNTMPALCTGTQMCDASTGLCVDVGQDGSSCQRDSECQSGRCYAREALGLVDTGGICARPCCTDTNCPDDMFCAAPGSGARGCVAGSRPPMGACSRSGDCGSSGECELGSGFTFQCLGSSGGGNGGTLCSENAECASGLCNGYCLDPCGAETDCARAPIWSTGQRACRYFGFTSGSSTRWVTVCRYEDRLGLETYPSATQGMPCGSDADCRDGFCSASRCSDACCNDDQCPSDHMCAPVDHRGWEMRCLPRAR